MPKAVLLDTVHPVAVDVYEAAGFEVEYFGKDESPMHIIGRLRDAEVLGLRTTPEIPAQIIEGAASLAVIGCYSSGTEHIAVDAASERGIPVFNSQDNSRSVAEYATTMAGVLVRRLFEHNRTMQEGRWSKTEKGAHELAGKTIGIVGLGEVGRRVADDAAKKEMDVLFYDPFVSQTDAGRRFTRADELNELLARSDVVSLHSKPLADGSPLIGAAEFAMMRDGVYFINSARAELVDTEALVAAWRSGKVAGAAIDVFEGDDPKAGDEFVSVLQGMDNVILTPHIAGSTVEAQLKAGDGTSRRAVKYLRTGEVVGSVNFPNTALEEPDNGNERIIWIHRNQPRMLQILIDVVAGHNLNIGFDINETRGDIGYAVVDVEGSIPDSLVTMLEGHEYTLRVRTLGA